MTREGGLSGRQGYTPKPVATRTDLTRPPIAEALIDFRSPDNEGLVPASLLPVREALQGRFPHVEERHSVQATFQIQEAQPVVQSRTTGFHGLFLKSADSLDVAQFRRDGFTVNRLAPYRGWRSLKSMALELLPLFLKHGRPERLSRVATRFINRLTLPISTGQSSSDYLAVTPTLPTGYPPLRSFLTRVTVHDAETGLSANVSHSLESSDSPYPTVLLDIDVFTEIPANAQLTVEGASEILERMRALKNTLFFATITDRAAALYK